MEARAERTDRLAERNVRSPLAPVRQRSPTGKERKNSPSMKGRNRSPSPVKPGSGSTLRGSSGSRSRSPTKLAASSTAAEEPKPIKRLTFKSPHHEDKYLRVVDLSNQGLTTVQSAYFNAKDVGEMNLSGNCLRTIPLDIRKLTHLISLNISRNGIKCSHPNDYGGLPAELDSLKFLETLIIAECNLQYIPPAVWRLKKLKKLDISRNKIQILVPEIGHLTKLEYLNLQQTGITTLPLEIAYCQELQQILLYGNAMESLPETLKELPYLCVLKMNHRSFCSVVDDYMENLIRKGQIQSEHVPQVLFEMPCPLSLDLEACKINNLPDECPNSLIEFNISKNYFHDVPKALYRIENLQYLDMSNNMISDLPQDIGQLKSVKVLKINSNVFETVPPSIGDLKHLEVLEMESNRIRCLPSEISNLTTLHTLKLAKNNIQALPDSICELYRLETLDLTDNGLTSLPLNLYKLSRLTSAHSYHLLFKTGLWLNKNPLVTPPEHVWKTTDIQKIYVYLQQLKIARTQLLRLKLILMGESQSGKTSLANAMISGKINLTAGKEDSTSIVEQRFLTTENGVNFMVYDLGGDPVYMFTHPMFLDPKALMMILYDHSTYNPDSFQSTIGKWIDLINVRTPGAVVKIVGTHTDLCEDEKVSQAKLQLIQEQVKKHQEEHEESLNKELESITDQIEKQKTIETDINFETPAAEFLEEQQKKIEGLLQNTVKMMPISIVSSTEGTKGVADVMAEMERLAVNENLFPHAHDIVDPEWDDFKSALRLHKTLFLTWDMAVEIGKSFKFDEEEVLHCLLYLRDTGDVVWFRGSSQLHDVIFHRPKYFVQVLRGIFKHNMEAFLDYEKNKVFSSKGKYEPDIFEEHRKMFLQHGQVSRQMMQCLWFYLKLGYDEFYALMDFIPRLDILYAIPQPDLPLAKHHFQPFAAIPWYNKDAEDISTVKGYWTPKLLLDIKELKVDYTFPLYYPVGLFERLSVRIQDIITERIDWKSLTYATTEDEQLLLRQHVCKKSGNHTLTIAVRGKKVEAMLPILIKLHNAFVEFASQWPGLVWYISKSYADSGKKATLDYFPKEVFDTPAPQNMSRRKSIVYLY
ncbi:malignant fibrous histiocytoma-amplified sequence 1 homolog isoform X2 [Lingula anatina]|nr:malignant fibrous histiocytoma-amplified sequence 1 homolog isoform X2 [Lingula anatina]XP_013397008.1 malignant fibrous histiocytoma-amplified sequence 1 homolog isoform X2 [Lingula anatina]XP_023931874.1 malignant fibrous histiocytoma-amplified sequence 1 homolog isoform X2 [Lingula anatina]|eukprot:XP_013397007.1 malignant fibrous histiocytoma-amplified sequence 1 homolog isoform X2 [Lingula anatina]